MLRSLIPTICGAVVCFLIGVMLYQSQMHFPEPAMNIWGIVSFAALGACIGNLTAPVDERDQQG